MKKIQSLCMVLLLACTSAYAQQTGLRGEWMNEYGFELLPGVSAMLRLTPKLTTRLGGGYGYKTPTVFTEEAERLQFQGILPIDGNATRNEQSIVVNWDISYRTTLGAVGFSTNHLFFYTRLRNPLVLVGAPGEKLEFQMQKAIWTLREWRPTCGSSTGTLNSLSATPTPMPIRTILVKKAGCPSPPPPPEQCADVRGGRKAQAGSGGLLL